MLAHIITSVYELDCAAALTIWYTSLLYHTLASHGHWRQHFMHSYSSLPIMTKGNTSVLQTMGAEMINKITANWNGSSNILSWSTHIFQPGLLRLSSILEHFKFSVDALQSCKLTLYISCLFINTLQCLEQWQWNQSWLLRRWERTNPFFPRHDL